MAEVKPLPGPPGYPLLGNLMEIDWYSYTAILTEWGRKYGPIYQFSVLGRKAVVLSSVEILEEAFEKNADATSGRPPTVVGDYITENDGIVFNSDLPAMTNLKRFYRDSLYSDTEMQTNIENGIRKVMEDLRRKLLDFKGADADMREATESTHINFTSYLLIGESLPEESVGYGAIVDFVDSLNQLLQPPKTAALVLYPFLKHVPFSKAGKVLRDTLAAKKAVEDKFFWDQKSSRTAEACRGLVDAFFIEQQEREKDSWPYDEQVQGVILDTMFAVGCQLMKACMILTKLLCAHPEMQVRIQSEIDAVIGQNEFPTTDMRSKLPFTQAAILESMRYCNQVSLTVPHFCTDDVTVAGYHIEKGTTLIGNIWAMNHDEDVWGDPLEYRPDRFLDDDGHMLPHTSKEMKSFVQFSRGSRKCPGYDLAQIYVYRYITSVLQIFTILPAEGAELPVPETILHEPPYTKPVDRFRFVKRK